MVKSSLKKLSTNYPTQVKIFYRQNHFFSSRTNLPNWATPHPSWTWGAPRASTRPRSRGASKSPVSSQNPRARHSTRPMKYSCSNHPTIRTSFSHIVFLLSVLKWLPSSWNWNRLVRFHRYLMLFTQVDHKDTLGIIKERRIDTNVYSQWISNINWRCWYRI